MTEPGKQTFIFVVDAHAGDLAASVTALERRFGADYAILGFASPERAREAVKLARDGGDDVALVLADLHLPGGGFALLEAIHDLVPAATRGMLISTRAHRLPVEDLSEWRRASIVGQVDLSILKDWVNPEEWFYLQVQEALSDWNSRNGLRLEVVKVVGEQWSRRSHALREILTRNVVPFGFYDVDSDMGRELLEMSGATRAELPVAVFGDGHYLSNPSAMDMAVALGVEVHAGSEVYDLIIIGAGPSGLAAAIYGESEGLHTLVVEQLTLGGQAGSSSMIRNYLGFPHGISGQDLTNRAFDQASSFGTEFLFVQTANGLRDAGGLREVTFESGERARARSVVIAIGVHYRRLSAPSIERLVGRGVYYGSAGVEARAMTGQPVYVVGGANSAGQAALHLAKYASSVTIVVRAAGLEATMSSYLIDELNATENITLRTRTEVVDAFGEKRLQGLALQDKTGRRETVRASGLFLLIGAEPQTDWLRGSVELDERGYIYTGRDLPEGSWPLLRMSLPFETSLPNVFAVGDVRHGSIKRVAGAVGEGSVAIGSVHQCLAELHGT
jgi:thioredoxin reductase (NADPH)